MHLKSYLTQGFSSAISASTLRATALLVMLQLSGCQLLPDSGLVSSDPIEQDGPPDVTLDPASLSDAVPQYEPRSRYGNHTPYTVLGKQYEVIEENDPITQEGIASWYGTKFHGKRTSSWEPYDMFAMTAAHRSLPLPTYVKVTNLKNRRSTIVKVNDRGPFHSDRIIDLSYAAAVKLGFANLGTAPVRIETIPMASLRPTSTPTPSSVPQQQLIAAKKAYQKRKGDSQLFVQVGAYSERARAEEIRQSISEWITFPINITKSDHKSLYRVQIGPLRSTIQAQAINQLLAKEFSINAPLIVWN